MMSISVSVKWKFPYRSITTYSYILHLKLDIYSSITSSFKSQTPNPLKSIIVVGILVQTPLPLTWWLITWKLPYFDKCRNYKSVQVRRDINLLLWLWQWLIYGSILAVNTYFFQKSIIFIKKLFNVEKCWFWFYKSVNAS